VAIADEFRGKGIGSLSFRTISDISKEGEFNYVLIDIENQHIDVDEAKVKRAQFYRRLGFRELNGMGYTAPPLKGMTPLNMIIVAYSKKGDNYLDGRLMMEALRQVFKEFFSWYMGEETLN
jgi:hypothetical protein